MSDSALINFFRDCGVVREVYRPRANKPAQHALARHDIKERGAAHASRAVATLERGGPRGGGGAGGDNYGSAVLTFGSAHASKLALEKNDKKMGSGDIVLVRASYRCKPQATPTSIHMAGAKHYK